MTVNHTDLRIALLDLADLARTEPDPYRRVALFQTFLREGSDIALDGMLETIYDLYQRNGRSMPEIAETFGLAESSVWRWITAYVERRGLPLRSRKRRFEQVIPIPPDLVGPLRASRPAGARASRASR